MWKTVQEVVLAVVRSMMSVMSVMKVWLLQQWNLFVRLHQVLRRQSSTPPPASTPPASTSTAPSMPDTPESQAAVHEAGHVIAAWFCTYIETVESAQIGAQGSGTVRHTYRAGGVPVLWCRMVIALAGVAAQAKVYRRWRAIEADDDLMKARQLASEVALTVPPWRERDTSRWQHDIERLYRVTVPDDEARALRRAYVMARYLLDRHELRLYRCAGLLLHRRNITACDLTAALGDRTLARVAGISQGFWVP